MIKIVLINIFLFLSLCGEMNDEVGFDVFYGNRGQEASSIQVSVTLPWIRTDVVSFCEELKM